MSTATVDDALGDKGSTLPVIDSEMFGCVRLNGSVCTEATGMRWVVSLTEGSDIVKGTFDAL